MLWLCKTNTAPRGVIYWLPSGGEVGDFVNTKVDDFIKENEKIAEAVYADNKDPDNIGLKKFYGVQTYWRGLKSKTAVKSISADADIFDEYDEADPGQIKQAEKRTAASDIKLRRMLSVPTIPDFGINKEFKATDQCHFAFKCEACSTWNILEENFPQCFKLNAAGLYYRACKKCKNELSMTKGQWVRKTHSPLRGYQISQLYSPWTTPTEIMHEFHTTEFMSHFYSHVLGLPYISATDRVMAESILAQCSRRPMVSGTNQPTVMGIDQGAKLHTVILEAKKPYNLIFAGELNTFEEVDHYIKKYSVRCMVIDAMPEMRKARELRQRNKGKVWLCFYNDNQKGSYAWKEDEGIVSVNRTESLDVGTDVLLNNLLGLPLRDPMIELFAKHCENIVKIVEENKETRSKRYVYKALAADHFRHALNYALIAHTSIKTQKPVSVFR